MSNETAPIVLDRLLDELISVCCTCDHQWAHQLLRWPDCDWFTLAPCPICACPGGRER